MKRFKRKLIIEQVYYNGEKDDIYEIKFTRHDLGKVSVEVKEIESRNAAAHLMARMSIAELIGFIKVADLAKSAELRGFTTNLDLEDAIFKTIIDEWGKINLYRTDVIEMFELSFEKDFEIDDEELNAKEEVSKEDVILEGIKGINEKLEKIFEFLVTQNKYKY